MAYQPGGSAPPTQPAILSGFLGLFPGGSAPPTQPADGDQGGYPYNGDPRSVPLTNPNAYQGQQPQTQVAPLRAELPQVGNGPEAQAQRCQNFLSEFHDTLVAVEHDLRSASPQQQGSLMGKAIKKCRGLDREAQALLSKLPWSDQTRAGLQQKLSQLHDSLRGLETRAKPYIKELPKASSSEEISDELVAKLSGEAPVLHERLDELSHALEAWDKAVRERTHFGALDPTKNGGIRREEQAVEEASAAFEDFRVKLTNPEKGYIAGKLSDAFLGSRKTANIDAEAARRGVELLRALQGFSQWSDPEKIQALLRKRLNFLTDKTLDPNLHRFTSGEKFLELVVNTERWPEAEPLAQRWPEVLNKNLSSRGAEEWKERSKREAFQGFIEEQPADVAAPVDSARGISRGSRSTQADSGRLRITKIRARNLRSADIWDPSDPYVIFSVGRDQARTEVIWDNENPEWRQKGNPNAWQEVSLRLPSLAANTNLHVAVWDCDQYTADDPLGEVNVDIATLLQRGGSGSAGQDYSIGNFFGFSSSRSSGPQGQFVSTGLLRLEGRGAGNKNPVIEFDVIWEPGAIGNSGSSIGTSRSRSQSLEGTRGRGSGGAPVLIQDPLLLQPQRLDTALAIVGRMEYEVPRFLGEFREKSLGFFLSEEDLTGDIVRHEEATGTSSLMKQVVQYNKYLSELQILTEGFNQNVEKGWFGNTRQTPRPDKAINYSRLQALVNEIRAVEQSTKGNAAKRQMFAYQDELLPSIGEWSTDRRRKLRDQVYLAGMDGNFVFNMIATWDRYNSLFPILIILALICHLIAAHALFYGGSDRGWIMIGWSMGGFLCVAGAIAVSLPKWKPYLDKPRRGASGYQQLGTGPRAGP